MKRRIEITQRQCESWARELAWKRSGFKNYDKLKEALRELPLEEKVDLILEALMSECAAGHFNKKGDFLRSLGHTTWVDGAEVFEYSKETYTGLDDCEFAIHELDFYPVEIDSNLCYTQMNATAIKQRKKEAKRND